MGFARRSSPDPDEDIVYVRKPREAAPVLDELTVVALTEGARTLDNLFVPAGAVGTIVAVWDGGKAYEVEFSEPVGTLVTVPSDKVRRV